MSESRPIGRPPKEFKTEYCQMLIDHCAKGYSIESFAGIVGVCKDTIYEWFKKYPDFSDSKKEAVEKSRVFWEKLAIDNIISTSGPGGQSLNSTIWIFNMKNRFRDEWRDKSEVDVAGKDGKELKISLNYARKSK